MVPEKLGLLEMCVKFFKSFHPEMKAGSRDDKELLDRIEVRNGLRQGCILFNLYVSVMAKGMETTIMPLEQGQPKQPVPPHFHC